MNRDIMILVLQIVRNGIGSTIDNIFDEDPDVTLERLDHVWRVCDINLARLERE